MIRVVAPGNSSAPAIEVVGLILGDGSSDDGAGATLPGMDSSGWVAVRCIFRSRGQETDGEAVFEERITLWREDVDRAIERAEEEAHTYAAETTWPPDWVTEYLGTAQAYLLFDEPGDGAEVFSLMRTSELGPTAYVERFFTTGREHVGQVEETGLSTTPGSGPPDDG